eukprot:scaffold5104_cov123-Isochrysis_galbana.AAC.5
MPANFCRAVPFLGVAYSPHWCSASRWRAASSVAKAMAQERSKACLTNFGPEPGGRRVGGGGGKRAGSGRGLFMLGEEGGAATMGRLDECRLGMMAAAAAGRGGAGRWEKGYK